MTRGRLTAPALHALLLTCALAACVPRPLGTPVPTHESIGVRGELAALLLSSGRYDEAAREYERLLGLDDRPEYRLGLARALTWGGRHREAERHLRILAAMGPAMRPPSAAIDSLLLSARANLDPDVDEAASWVAERPTHTPYRAALVRALVRERRLEEALAEMEVILATERTAELLVQRAWIHSLRRDQDAAEADLEESIAIEPTAAAWIALGDLQRERGDHADARISYESARWLRPGHPDVEAAFARLERDERPPLTGLAVPGQETGYAFTFGGVRDNAGISYVRTGARRGFDGPAGLSAAAGLEHRYLREGRGGETMASHGVAGEVAAARTVGHGVATAAVGLGLGGVHHGGDGAFPTARLAAVGMYRAWIAGAELTSGPAYPSLMTGASLATPGSSADPLRARGVTVVAGGPLGRTDAALVWQRSAISDGNARTAVTLTVRHPLARRWSAIYAGQGITFAARSPLYWDPSGYVDNAVGLEFAERRVHGLSLVARGRVGVAWSDEAPFMREPADAGASGARLRLDFASDLGYRAERWEVAVSYAAGRVGVYQRHEGTLVVRIAP